MRAYERFLNYAKVNTESAEGTGKSPSTDCQWDLARLLVEELKTMGMEDAKVSDGHRPCLFRRWRGAHCPREL